MGILDKIKISIFVSQQDIIELDSVLILSNQASKDLISSIDFLLKKFKLTLKDLFCVFVDSGPGAFTTLRTIAATVNGLAFKNDLKLYPFNSLEQLVLSTNAEKVKNNFNFVVGCVNAYGKQVYTSIFCCETQRFVEKDLCLQLEQFRKILEDLHEEEKRICLVGNGLIVYEKELDCLDSEFFVFEKNLEIDFLILFSKISKDDCFFKSEVFPNYIKPGF